MLPGLRGSPAFLLAGVPALCLLVGCSPPSLQVAPAGEAGAGPFRFLQLGRTTREEVLLRLGTPHAHFGGERILVFAYSQGPHPVTGTDGVWRRGLRQSGYAVVPKDTQELVLVFDEAGVLARMSLVAAK